MTVYVVWHPKNLSSSVTKRVIFWYKAGSHAFLQLPVKPTYVVFSLILAYKSQVLFLEGRQWHHLHMSFPVPFFPMVFASSGIFSLRLLPAFGNLNLKIVTRDWWRLWRSETVRGSFPNVTSLSSSSWPDFQSVSIPSCTEQFSCNPSKPWVPSRPTSKPSLLLYVLGLQLVSLLNTNACLQFSLRIDS